MKKLKTKLTWYIDESTELVQNPPTNFDLYSNNSVDQFRRSNR